jgi:hypothetical protein
MGVLAELSRLCVPANLSAKGTSSTLRAYSLGEGLLDIFANGPKAIVASIPTPSGSALIMF